MQPITHLPDPPSTPVAQSGKPGESIETAIGAAVASAVTAICQAGEELQHGGLTATTRRVGAERIYRLHELRQSVPEIDFAATAHREGKRMLRRYLDADPDFHRHHAPGAGDATLDRIIAEVLVVLGRVVEFERAMAN